MNIVVEKEEARTIVKVSGRMNSANSSELEKKFLDIIESGSTFLVVDMSELEYISSAGLRVMLIAYKKIKAINGRIVLCALQEIVEEVFDLSNFSSIFEIVPSIEDIT